MLYWDHRIFHIPFLYKLTHKVHHKYKQPTPFVGLADHTVETLIALLISGSLCFLFPVHWGKIRRSMTEFKMLLIFIFLVTVTLVILLSNYAVHALLDHSGVNFKAHWWQSWQLDTEFHDDHHKYTHVNFGSQMKYWDQVSYLYSFPSRKVCNLSTKHRRSTVPVAIPTWIMRETKTRKTTPVNENKSSRATKITCKVYT